MAFTYSYKYTDMYVRDTELLASNIQLQIANM